MAITITVEDGTGLAGANSYVSAADADIYHSNRGRSSWGLLTADAKATALIAGTQFIDSIYNWIGSRRSKTQGLKWPRIQGLDDSGNAILLVDRDGFDIDAVPQAVVDACAEAAFLSLTDDLFQDTDPRGKIVRKKTDVLETEYQPDSAQLKPAPPTIFGALNAILKGLYIPPSSGMVIGKAVRG
jgi:hypothetical protein